MSRFFHDRDKRVDQQKKRQEAEARARAATHNERAAAKKAAKDQATRDKATAAKAKRAEKEAAATAAAEAAKRARTNSAKNNRTVATEKRARTEAASTQSPAVRRRTTQPACDTQPEREVAQELEDASETAHHAPANRASAGGPRSSNVPEMQATESGPFMALESDDDDDSEDDSYIGQPPREATAAEAGQRAQATPQVVFGPVHALFSVVPRGDCDQEALVTVLSHIASSYLRYTVTDTVATANLHRLEDFWPLEYVSSSKSRVPEPADAVVQRTPLVLRAASLLTCADAKLDAELRPLLGRIFGQTVVVPTEQAAHEYRQSLRHGAPLIVALDGAKLMADGRCGRSSASRAPTRFSELRGARFLVSTSGS